MTARGGILLASGMQKLAGIQSSPMPALASGQESRAITTTPRMAQILNALSHSQAVVALPARHQKTHRQVRRQL